MGHVDPIDLLKAPSWVPRITRLKGIRVMALFRDIVDQTMDKRRQKIHSGGAVPDDFLTLLLRQEGPDGLTREEIKDNIITFIGAGHETTARALGWTLYCLANSTPDLEILEKELDAFFAGSVPEPQHWLDRLPMTRAAFEEAMRLYPPAPSINRAAIADDLYGDVEIKAGVTVLVMPWTLTGIAACGTSLRHSFPRVSGRRTGGRLTSFSICHLAQGRGSASVPVSHFRKQ